MKGEVVPTPKYPIMRR